MPIIANPVLLKGLSSAYFRKLLIANRFQHGIVITEDGKNKTHTFLHMPLGQFDLPHPGE